MRGFFFKKHFYEVNGSGHEALARKIVLENGWKCSGMDYQDFLVQKGAIQVGSGSNPRCIIGYYRHYSRRDLDQFAEKHGLTNYDIHIVQY